MKIHLVTTRNGWLFSPWKDSQRPLSPAIMTIHDDCVRSTQMSISLSIFTVKSAFMKFMMLILAAWRRPILTCSLWERFGVINVGGRSNTGCLYSCCHCSYCRMCRGTASSATCVKRELKSCYCLTGASVFWLIRKNKAQPYSLTQTHLHTLNALAISTDYRCMGSAQEIVKQWQQMIQITDCAVCREACWLFCFLSVDAAQV